MATGKAKKRDRKTRPPADSPITVGGGGRIRGPKLWVKIEPDEWDLSRMLADGYMKMKATKGAKRLTLTAGAVSITVPLKGSINMELAVGDPEP